MALSQGHSAPHFDHHDAHDGLTCVMPFGDFTGGDFIIHDYGTRITLREGDVLFFRSWLQLHSTMPVTSGQRYSIVFFTHERMLDPKVQSTADEYEEMARRRLAKHA